MKPPTSYLAKEFCGVVDDTSSGAPVDGKNIWGWFTSLEDHVWLAKLVSEDTTHRSKRSEKISRTLHHLIHQSRVWSRVNSGFAG